MGQSSGSGPFLPSGHAAFGCCFLEGSSLRAGLGIPPPRLPSEGSSPGGWAPLGLGGRRPLPHSSLPDIKRGGGRAPRAWGAPECTAWLSSWQDPPGWTGALGCSEGHQAPASSAD